MEKQQIIPIFMTTTSLIGIFLIDNLSLMLLDSYLGCICLYFSFICFDVSSLIRTELKKQTEGKQECSHADFENEKKQIIGKFAEEEKKQRDREEQERKDAFGKEIKILQDSSVLFNKIYEKTIGSKVHFLFLNHIDTITRIC